ncbi:MAG TPA: NUDIX hydrolase [Actinomycetota bacterium]
MSSERPLVGVGAVVVRDGALLMVQRGKEPYLGRWSVPGGTLELGEHLTEAARREVLEETGVDVEVGELLGILEWPGTPHYVILDYVATPRGEDEPRPGGDASAVRWVPLDEIPALECTPRFVETLRGWGVLTDE